MQQKLDDLHERREQALGCFGRDEEQWVGAPIIYVKVRGTRHRPAALLHVVPG